MLADGLAGRGVAVTVAGPTAADTRLAFSAVPGVAFAAVEIGDRPRRGDLASILRLRGLLAASADVVHAHGLRAGALSLIALTLVRGGRRPRTVVTAHNAPPSGGGAPALVYRLLERLVARRADLVLCVSPDLEARMRAAGARRVEPAVIAAPDDPAAQPGSPLGVPTGRPVVLGAGRLAPQKGFGVLLEAAAAWRDLDPVPLVVIAGDGPLGGELMAKAAELGVDAVFVGHRADIPALLAIAAVFVLPSQWEGQPLVLQEALRAGTPVVATRVGGIPGLAGDEALLVPPGDAPALAAAVRSVLTDPLLGAALRVAAASRASLLPSPADAVDAALTAYAACLRRPLTPPDEPPARVRSPPASRPRRSAGKPSLRSAIIGGCP
jgi:glycosyltransferase involved in cell wall biosynthesis